MTKNHSFYEFNNSINKDRSKILYLVDLSFQESLRQNLLYVELYEKDLIKKSKRQNDFFARIQNKIKKINNTENIIINDKNIKKDIVYFNYAFFEIKNLQSFFDYIKKDFEYVLIEETQAYYLSSEPIRIQIKDYVKNNFLLEKTQYEQNKNFLRSYRSVIHYCLDIINIYDLKEDINNNKLEKVYGSNYSLYKLI